MGLLAINRNFSVTISASGKRACKSSSLSSVDSIFVRFIEQTPYTEIATEKSAKATFLQPMQELIWNMSLEKKPIRRLHPVDRSKPSYLVGKGRLSGVVAKVFDHRI
jgi:hypothetical protein